MYITNMFNIYVNNLSVLVIRIFMAKQHCVGERVRTKESEGLNLSLTDSVDLNNLSKLPPSLYP